MVFYSRQRCDSRKEHYRHLPNFTAGPCVESDRHQLQTFVQYAIKAPECGSSVQNIR